MLHRSWGTYKMMRSLQRCSLEIPATRGQLQRGMHHWQPMPETASLTVKVAVDHPAPVIVVVHGQHRTPCNAGPRQHAEGCEQGFAMAMRCTPSRTGPPGLVGLKSRTTAQVALYRLQSNKRLW